MICQFVCVHVVLSCKNLIDLRKHLDTHSSEPAYRCDFTDCDYSTRSLYSIKNHYKRVHEVRHSGKCLQHLPIRKRRKYKITTTKNLLSCSTEESESHRFGTTCSNITNAILAFANLAIKTYQYVSEIHKISTLLYVMLLMLLP